MEDDNTFSQGFGIGPKPFTFDNNEMDPFGNDSSPWADTPPTMKSPDISNGKEEEQDIDSDKEGERLKQMSINSSDESVPVPELKDNEHSTEDSVADNTDSRKSPATSKGSTEDDGVLDELKESAKAASQTGIRAGFSSSVQTARRVGVIKRGMRSPRVVGSQMLSEEFEDPLSNTTENDEASEEAPISASRPSSDGISSSRARGRQSFSRTEANIEANILSPNRNTLASPQLAPAPHPYDQQISPPQQREQELHATQTTDPSKLRTSASSGRGSNSSSAGRQSVSTSHVYLSAHQRRKSLEPTPENEMPKFDIQVMEPVKVNDSLKSYIAYKIKTNTDARIFKESEMIVRRRYRDFDWLIQELIASHPGVVVPAIPEKQSMGRFEDEFVEVRRAGLESCLIRISEHPVLWSDSAFRLFLEADDFASKARSITENRIASEISGLGPSLSSSSGGGLFGDGWGSSKYKEKDEWFSKRMQELDAVEQELRALLRALEYGQRQRKELSIAHGELGEAYLRMAGQELNKSLSNSLTDMGSLQQKLKVLQSRQGTADLAAFQLTTDEYIRMINSVRTAFSARGRAYGRWQSSLSDLIKRRKVLEGYVQHPGRASSERISQLKSEIARAEIRTEGNRNAFDDVSAILKQEFSRFDIGRVRDFQATVDAYLDSLIETQEQIVSLWDAYLTSIRNYERPARSGGSSGGGSGSGTGTYVSHQY